MTCAEVRSRFSELYDRQLSGVEQMEVRRHLGDCSRCEAERAAYTADMESLSASLHRLVADQEPSLGVAAATAPASRWQAFAAMAAGLLLAVGVAGWMWERGAMTTTVSLGGAPAARVAHDPASCPWKRAALGEVHRTVSYPVAADECLDRDFELVEAKVRHGFPCDETLRLTYRAGNRHLVLEQHPEQAPAQCPGESFLLGEIAGCFERLSREGTSLWWSHRNHAFHLEGDVAPGEAVQVVQAIALAFGR